jgi:hypothetical protein
MIAFAKSGQPNNRSLFSVGNDMSKIDPTNTAVLNALFDEGDDLSSKVLRESFCAVYQGLSAGDKRIITEGFTDFFGNVIEFFKKLISKIVNFFKNAFNYLTSYFMDFDKFIKKYEGNINFEEFTANIYEYTIPDKPIDRKGITDLVGTYNADLKRIRKMDEPTFKNYITQRAGTDKIDAIRNAICNTKFVKKNKYKDELAKMFRNGKSDTHEETINTGNIRDYISKFRQFKSQLKALKEEQSDVLEIVEDFRDFFSSTPERVELGDGKRKVYFKTLVDSKNAGERITNDKQETVNSKEYERISAFYGFCFRIAKEVCSMYTLAFTSKIAALKEAMGAYKKIIRKALNPMNSTDGSTEVKESAYEGEVHDYVYEAESFMNDTSFDDFFTVFESQYIELSVLTEAYLTGRMVIMEDKTDVSISEKDGDGNKKPMYQKIWEFLKKLVNAFIEKATNLFTSNSEWFKENGDRFNKITDNQYQQIKVTIYDYKFDGIKPAEYNRTNVNGRLTVQDAYDDKKGPFKTKDDMKKLMFKGIETESMDKDIINGFKNHWRGTTKTTTFQGMAVKGQVKKMLGFCQDYKSKAEKIKEAQDELQEEIDKASSIHSTAAQKEAEAPTATVTQKADDKKNTKTGGTGESMFLSELDGVPIVESVIGGIPWFAHGENCTADVIIAMEADAKDEQKENTTASEDAKKSKAATQASTNGNVELKGQQSEGAPPPANKSAASKLTANAQRQMWYIQLKMIPITTAMTILEEIYVTYIKTLRDILVAAESTSSASTGDDKK